MAFGIIRGALLAASAVLAFSTSGIARPAQQNPHAKRVHGAARAGGDRALTVLYDQSSKPSGFGTVSQDFGDEFTSQAADDFTVPLSAHWTIKEIDAPGAYFQGSGPATEVRILIYAGERGKPRNVVNSQTATPTSDDSGSFVFTLPFPIKLRPGHYWLSIVPVMSFESGGEWFWENQKKGTKEGKTANWQNPGDGYGSGCTAWTAEPRCVVNQLGDQVFTLKGVAKSRG